MSNAAVEWARPPVDDIGYISSEKLLELNDDDLADLVINFEHARYSGWRNFNGNWRRVLKMDDTTGKVVMDYGCGVGIEGLQYARAGNMVMPVDIVPENVQLAQRVLNLFGFPVKRFEPHIDVVHSAGCLHHIPTPEVQMVQWLTHLNPGGEVRLMLYSDWAWRIATGLEPPVDTAGHPLFETYVRHWDAVGSYADWYDADKLESWFGEWFELENFEYLTQDMAYCGAVLVSRK